MQETTTIRGGIATPIGGSARSRVSTAIQRVLATPAMSRKELDQLVDRLLHQKDDDIEPDREASKG